MMRCRCFFEYALSSNSCRKTLSSPPRAIQQQLRIWCRSSCMCLGRVFEVIQECAMRTICLTDAQQLPVPGAEENERGQGRERSQCTNATIALAAPAPAWSHLGATKEPMVRLAHSSGARATLPSPPAWATCCRTGGRHMGRERDLLPGAVGCRCPPSSHLLCGPSHRDSLSVCGSLQTAGGRSQESPVNALILVFCHFRYRCGFG